MKCDQLHTTEIKSWNAAQSFLNELFDEETIRKSQIEKWFKKFKLDNINLARRKISSNFR